MQSTALHYSCVNSSSTLSKVHICLGMSFYYRRNLYGSSKLNCWLKNFAPNDSSIRLCSDLRCQSTIFEEDYIYSRELLVLSKRSPDKSFFCWISESELFSILSLLLANFKRFYPILLPETLRPSVDEFLFVELFSS